ncbi:MAG: nitroreductase family deazaflavin-dependent oxidoreductase [Chloroflexota bacterium]
MAAEPLTDDRDRSGRSSQGAGAARGFERNPDLDAALAADERFARLRILGRRTGSERSVTVGYVAGEGETIVVAAGTPDAAWARNVLAQPSVEVSVAGRTFAAVAEPLEDGDPRRGRAVRDLILRYGTPSEGLGSGPIFILHPVADAT